MPAGVDVDLCDRAVQTGALNRFMSFFDIDITLITVGDRPLDVRQVFLP